MAKYVSDIDPMQFDEFNYYIDNFELELISHYQDAQEQINIFETIIEGNILELEQREYLRLLATSNICREFFFVYSWLLATYTGRKRTEKYEQQIEALTAILALRPPNERYED
ncbi:hypothetical protein PQ465_08555 [Sphingobacterium oryzagri]|uniref:Uncharacterized protein n=1 Tax=Sphingobacterium oryzagri TaxID=3025669 RepID=A0ABY7WLE2_9SPHI|nr:hypothetical protein [Sphingobacterium sp. KACC 22765]WDF70413.1 hypothetical protein PQ465_08555 [Sphingobacterium sp. KACC 22765]